MHELTYEVLIIARRYSMYIANNNIIQKGFSGFSLKIIALVFNDNGSYA